MTDNTTITWTEASWNPMTGCTKVSPGCDNCYAETFAERWRGVPGHYFEQGFDIQPRMDKLHLPLRWKRPRRIFVNSMSDLFHPEPTVEFIAGVFKVMAWAPQHTFQVLTKRHGRMRSLLNRSSFQDSVLSRAPGATWPLPNVWLGVSVEDQWWADIRIPALLDTPAAVRWVSAEPLLGPVDLHWCGGVDAIQPDWVDSPGAGTGTPHPLLSWVVCGGESGPGARSMDIDWARTLRDQCRDAGVPFFFKQLGSRLARGLGVPGKGEDFEALPAEFQIREYPAPPAK